MISQLLMIELRLLVSSPLHSSDSGFERFADLWSQSPDGRVFINPTGNAGLGTAGAGDTLTGLISGFLAQAYGTLETSGSGCATVAALYVGGLAGDFAAKNSACEHGRSDIREHFSDAIRFLDPRGEQP